MRRCLSVLGFSLKPFLRQGGGRACARARARAHARARARAAVMSAQQRLADRLSGIMFYSSAVCLPD